jgi:hypothetical protein
MRQAVLSPSGVDSPAELARPAWNARRAMRWTVGMLCLGAAACSNDPIGRTVPVRGEVTFDGKPLGQGSLAFWPDAEKGNKADFEAGAEIGPDGTYELSTRGRTGAPPGAYKVTVAAQVPMNPKDRYSRPKLLVPEIYTDKNTTPLRVEVVDNPGPDAYKLTLN